MFTRRRIWLGFLALFGSFWGVGVGLQLEDHDDIIGKLAAAGAGYYVLRGIWAEHAPKKRSTTTGEVKS